MDHQSQLARKPLDATNNKFRKRTTPNETRNTAFMLAGKHGPSTGKENMTGPPSAKKVWTSLYQYQANLEAKVAVPAPYAKTKTISKSGARATPPLGAGKQFKQAKLSFSNHSASAQKDQGMSVRLPSVAPPKPADAAKSQLSKKRSSAAILGALKRKDTKPIKKGQPLEPPAFYKRALPAEPLWSMRLQLREFVTRFERLFKQIPSKHLSWLCDPFSTLAFLSFRHLAAGMLRLLLEKHNEPLLAEETILKLALQEVERATVRNGQLWPVLVDFLGHQKVLKQSVARQADRVYENKVTDKGDDEQVADVVMADTASDLSSIASDSDADDYQEETFDAVQQLSIIMDLLHLCLQCEAIRKELDLQANEARAAATQSTKDKADLRAKYEQVKHALHTSQYKTSNKKEVTLWQAEWVAARDQHEKEMLACDVHLFAVQRAARLRQKPVGVDVLGNEVWLFGDRTREAAEKNLGCRVVLMPAPKRCSPLCEAKRNNHAACTQLDVAVDPLASLFDDEDDAPALTPVAGDEKPNAETNQAQAWWYEVKTVAEVKKLVAWMLVHAHAKLPEKPTHQQLLDRKKKELVMNLASTPVSVAKAAQVESASRSTSTMSLTKTVSEEEDVDELDLLVNTSAPIISRVQLAAVVNAANAIEIDSDSDLTDLSDLSSIEDENEVLTLEKMQGIVDRWQQIEALTDGLTLFAQWLTTVEQDEGNTT